jgi:hypothetical protein
MRYSLIIKRIDNGFIIEWTDQLAGGRHEVYCRWASEIIDNVRELVTDEDPAVLRKTAKA